MWVKVAIGIGVLYWLTRDASAAPSSSSSSDAPTGCPPGQVPGPWFTCVTPITTDPNGTITVECAGGACEGDPASAGINDPVVTTVQREARVLRNQTRDADWLQFGMDPQLPVYGGR